MMHCFSLDVEVDLYEQFFSFYLMVGIHTNLFNLSFSVGKIPTEKLHLLCMIFHLMVGVPTNHIYLVVSVGEDTNR